MTKTIPDICDTWETNYNSYNWEPEFKTIIVTWHLRVTLDSIRNSCDIYLLQPIMQQGCLLQKWCQRWSPPRQSPEVYVLLGNWSKSILIFEHGRIVNFPFQGSLDGILGNKKDNHGMKTCQEQPSLWSRATWNYEKWNDSNPNGKVQLFQNIFRQSPQTKMLRAIAAFNFFNYGHHHGYQ